MSWRPAPARPRQPSFEQGEHDEAGVDRQPVGVLRGAFAQLCPDEVLTDSGKQFTDRFGAGGEVLFDRICRDNGIVHRLTQPSAPTTTGKVERLHSDVAARAVVRP
jgi:transposase InsO family protein